MHNVNLLWTWFDGVEYDPPYSTDGMTTEKWMKIVPTAIEPMTLTPTQDAVHNFTHGGSSYCHDAYPHVVYKDYQYFLEDGHHRVAHAIYIGLPLIAVRVLVV